MTLFTDYLVAIVDRQHGHFYRYKPQTKRLSKIDEIIDMVPKTVKGASWKGLADDRVARHVEAHVREHFKHLLPLMERELRAAGRGLVIGGPEDVLVDFEPLLPTHLRERLIGTIHPDHGSGLKELTELVDQAVHRGQRASIERLLKNIAAASAPGGRGIVTPEELYESLQLRQLHLVLIDPHRPYPGFICEKDGSLSTMFTQCPSCLGVMVPKDNLKEAIMQSAQAQDAEVILVEDTDLLEKHQGIAGLRRFA